MYTKIFLCEDCVLNKHKETGCNIYSGAMPTKCQNPGCDNWAEFHIQVKKPLRELASVFKQTV